MSGSRSLVKQLSGLVPASIPLEATVNVSDEKARANAIVAFAPYLTSKQQREALTAVRLIGHEQIRAIALSELVPCLSEELRTATIPEAIQAIRAIRNEPTQALALARLVPWLRTKVCSEIISEIINLAKSKKPGFGVVFRDIVPHLTKAQRSEAIEVLTADPEFFWEEITILLPHLTEEMRSAAFASIMTTEFEWYRPYWWVFAVGNIASHLSDSQRDEVFTAAMAINRDDDRIKTLEILAPYLTKAQLDAVMLATKEFNFELSREFMLAVIAPYLAEKQRNEIIKEAEGFHSKDAKIVLLSRVIPLIPEGDRASLIDDLILTVEEQNIEQIKYLIDLVPYLAERRRFDVLRIVTAIEDGSARSSALAKIFAHLTGELREDAFIAIRSLDSWEFSEALRIIVPHLTGEQRSEALEITKAIDFPVARASGLSALLPHLNSTQLVDAFSAAKAITDDFARTIILERAPQHLTVSQRAELWVLYGSWVQLTNGTTHYHKHSLDLALQSFSKDIESNHRSAYAFSNRGVVYRDIHEHERALKDLDCAIELDSTNSAAYNNRGVLYRDVGKLLCAIAEFDRAIELNRKNASAFNNRAVAYFDCGMFDRAIAYFSRAIALDPQNGRSIKNRAIACYQRGNEADFEVAQTDEIAAAKLDFLSRSALEYNGSLQLHLQLPDSAAYLRPTEDNLPNASITDEQLLNALKQRVSADLCEKVARELTNPIDSSKVASTKEGSFAIQLERMSMKQRRAALKAYYGGKKLDSGEERKTWLEVRGDDPTPEDFLKWLDTYYADRQTVGLLHGDMLHLDREAFLKLKNWRSSKDKKIKRSIAGMGLPTKQESYNPKVAVKRMPTSRDVRDAYLRAHPDAPKLERERQRARYHVPRR